MNRERRLETASLLLRNYYEDGVIVMKNNYANVIALALLGALLLVACGGGNTPTAEGTEVPLVADEFEVIAEGLLVPHAYVNLSFTGGGRVAQILVAEGDQVQAGQALARLSDVEQLESARATAELERLMAQQALDTLVENADLASAQALMEIAAARDAVRDAGRRVTNLEVGGKQVDIDSASSDVVLLRDKLDEAQEDFEPYEDKPEDNLTRATLQAALADAQRKYDDAVRLLNNLEGEANEIDLAIAQAELAIAQAQLALAETRYEEVKDGPDPDELASAEARLEAAEAGLAAAETVLADAQLSAPFAGTIVDVNIKVGEQVGPGEPAVVLADFSEWMVETDNLTEIEVPQVSVGQNVQITPDALPELSLDGTVLSISDLFEEKRGDITYTAKIALDEFDPRLRWGMTVVVTFLEP